MTTCTCGRGWDHCRICGGRSIYRLKTESMVAGVDVWQCKKCMKPTSELSACQAAPNRESKDFVSKEKAIRDLAKLPIEEKLHAMIEKGASVEEIKDAARAAGLTVVDEEAKPAEDIKLISRPSLEEPSKVDGILDFLFPGTKKEPPDENKA